ncbi:unnamed protein product [Ambrosiozyma monospora]|uniref:Unnamed protein product n=1 Tax=Ambrosiozyma monospora TaxID=43982 RepID=A0A9W6YU21_AMBMO|nr:unnamed protein product [Ambrosiozyma monospora]
MTQRRPLTDDDIICLNDINTIEYNKNNNNTLASNNSELLEGTLKPVVKRRLQSASHSKYKPLTHVEYCHLYGPVFLTPKAYKEEKKKLKKLKLNRPKPPILELPVCTKPQSSVNEFSNKMSIPKSIENDITKLDTYMVKFEKADSMVEQSKNSSLSNPNLYGLECDLMFFLRILSIQRPINDYPLTIDSLELIHVPWHKQLLQAMHDSYSLLSGLRKGDTNQLLKLVYSPQEYPDAFAKLIQIIAFPYGKLSVDQRVELWMLERSVRDDLFQRLMEPK